MRFEIDEILKVCSGILFNGNKLESHHIDFISVDGEIKENTLVVPIECAVSDYYSNGCSYKNKPIAIFSSNYNEIPRIDFPLIYVEDEKEAFYKLATYHRNKYQIGVIGITGSVGKTTTTDMINLLLSCKFNTLKTLDNNNSLVGLPLTMFRLNKKYQMAVVEIGIKNKGEMKKLASIAQPRCAVITNIGSAHAAFLENKETTFSEKLHITDYFQNDSIVFLNRDDNFLSSLSNSNKLKNIKKVWYGLSSNCDYRAEDIAYTNKGMIFKCIVANKFSRIINIPVYGVHNVRNALAAIAVAHEFGIDYNDIVDSFAGFKSSPMRMQFDDLGTVTLIDDTFNSSPESVYVALEVISEIKKVKKLKRSVVILGEMALLGEKSSDLHFLVGQKLSLLNIDLLIAVGEHAKNIVDGAKSINNGILHRSYPSNEKLNSDLHNIINDGDVVLVKGSRSTKMEIVTEHIRRKTWMKF